MADSAPEVPFNFYVQRGNRWTQPFVFTHEDTGFDWTGVGITCEVKASRDRGAAVLATLTVTADFADNVATLAIDLSGSDCADLPKAVYGDVRVYRASPLFGPYNVTPFVLNVGPAITA